jgi:hypothetical protein
LNMSKQTKQRSFELCRRLESVPAGSLFRSDFGPLKPDQPSHLSRLLPFSAVSSPS